MGGLICVYTIANKTNGRLYVGKTGNPYQRWNDHRYEGRRLRKRENRISHSPLYVAMHAEGEANFEFKPIEWCASDEDACKAESYWIEWYRTLDPAHGYNASTGGWGSTGHVVPAHKRAQASALFKGKTQSPEFVAARIAKRCGVSVEEFMEHRARGEHYCGGAGIRDPHWTTKKPCPCAAAAYERRRKARRAA
jgi:group I intron endonuclease